MKDDSKREIVKVKIPFQSWEMEQKPYDKASCFTKYEDLTAIEETKKKRSFFYRIKAKKDSNQEMGKSKSKRFYRRFIDFYELVELYKGNILEEIMIFNESENFIAFAIIFPKNSVATEFKSILFEVYPETRMDPDEIPDLM